MKGSYSYGKMSVSGLRVGRSTFSQGDYVCKLCNKNISENEVKNKCKTDYGEEYEKCPVYKNR